MARGNHFALLGMTLFTTVSMFLFVTINTRGPGEHVITYNNDDVNLITRPHRRSGTREISASENNVHTNCGDVRTAQLAAEVRVACVVLTCPAMLDNRTRYIQQTWAKRCNAIEYISSQTNKTFPTIGVSVPEGRKGLTGKVLQGTRVMYEKYFKNRNDFDWLFMADDDTYAIMENLRYFLREKDPEKLVYYGQHFKPFVPGGYATGGAGVAIGRGILHKLFTTETKEVRECLNRTGDDGDTNLAACLHAIGAVIGQSTDKYGNSRFHHYSPWTHLQDKYMTWYNKFDFNGPTHGIHKISHYAITFHYIEGPMMLEYDYFLYHLRPFGLVGEDLQLNRPGNTAVTIGNLNTFGLLHLSVILIAYLVIK